MGKRRRGKKKCEANKEGKRWKKERRKGERKRKMDELGHSTTKRKCHISCRCFVYSRPNIRLLGNIWKIQCSFHCTDNCWQCYRLFLYVYVSIPFKPFCGQIIKACSVGGVTSHWPQKLIFPATKYTAPANEVVITERACSAEVTPSGDKGRGRGPVERAEPLFPSVSVACWSSSC